MFHKRINMLEDQKFDLEYEVFKKDMEARIRCPIFDWAFKQFFCLILSLFIFFLTIYKYFFLPKIIIAAVVTPRKHIESNLFFNQ